VTNAKDLGHPEFYLEGLWYPIVTAVSFVVGMVYIKIKIKTLTNKKHSYESNKKNFRISLIKLATAIFASSLLITKIYVRQTRRFSIRNNHFLYCYTLIVLGLGTFVLFFNGRLMKKS
jgi:uncharacterized membrane protein